MTCDRPVCYDEDRENIDDDLECLRTKPYCTNKGNAVDWRARCLAAEARLTAYPLPRGQRLALGAQPVDRGAVEEARWAQGRGSRHGGADSALREFRISDHGSVVLAARLRTFPVPFDDHFQLVGAVDECRSMMEPPVDKERST